MRAIDSKIIQDLGVLLLGPVAFVTVICLLPLEDPCKGVMTNMGYGIFWYGVCASLNFTVQFRLNFLTTRIPSPHWSTIPKLLFMAIWHA
jgi:hypothetical protein